MGIAICVVCSSHSNHQILEDCSLACAQLSILESLEVSNCTSLRSWPKLPLNIVYISGFGCTSLETLPDLLQPNSLFGEGLLLTNCSKLAENQGFVDMFFAMIINSLRLPLPLPPDYRYGYDIIFPGSEIPKWFRHQSIGVEISIQEPYSLLCNEWMGIAVCVVFCCLPHHQIHVDCCHLFCRLTINGKQINLAPGIIGNDYLSDHIWLLYLLPQYYEKKDKNSLCKCDANGFSQIGIKIDAYCRGLKTSKIFPNKLKVKKCGLRMVYKKDIEDLNRTMAERSNNRITRDDCDGAGSSNYEPHPKRIERLTEFMVEEWLKVNTLFSLVTNNSKIKEKP
nr:disease resistance protein rps4 [Quercus suber]